jgi:hypothetical protein
VRYRPAPFARVEGKCPPDSEQSHLARPFALENRYISEDAELLAFGTRRYLELRLRPVQKTINREVWK